MSFFSAIWNKIKEIASKMLPKRNIENILHITPAVSDRMSEAITLWSSMYEGHAPWLREPVVGGDPTRIVSLGLPAFIASEKARMVTLEMKSEISAPTNNKEQQLSNASVAQTSTIQNSGIGTKDNTSATITSIKPKTNERAEFLNERYQKKLLKSLRRQLEYGIAKGGLVIKPYITHYEKKTDSEGNAIVYSKDLPEYELEFDFVQADRFFPLAFNANNKVVKACFVQFKTDKEKERVYTRLEYHTLEGRTVRVYNMAFESTDLGLASSNDIKTVTNLGNPIPLSKVPEWASFEPETVIEGVDRLLFAYFKMPEANTIDPYSPLGVSGYSRVVNLIKDADMQYSRLLWEYEGGELAIDVDRNALEFREGEGSVLPVGQKRLFRKVDLNAEDTYNVFAPTLRDISIINGLNTIFMRIEDACGISRGTLSDVTSLEAKTATELKILKQRSYATNADIQMALQDTLEDAVYVMDVLCTLYEVTPDGDYDISFEWDDSILVDSESELSKRLTLMTNGLASKLETRMWYYGETAEQAKAALDLVNKESDEAMIRNNEIQAKYNNEGQSVKSAGDTSSAKQSTGQQADSLDNPNKSSTNKSNINKNSITIK